MMGLPRLFIVILFISSEVLSQHCYRKCNCLKQTLTMNKCTQNINMLDIELHDQEIVFNCNSISADLEDVPSFDARYLTAIDDQSPLTLASMVKRCYNSKVRGVRYALDLDRLHNISATKNVLNKNNTIKYLKFDKKSNRSDIMVFQTDFLTYASQLSTLVINNLKIPILKKYFEHLAHIETLDLALNQIATIEDLTFKLLGNLRQLNLRHNKISNLSERSLEGLNNLTYLELSHNEITMIDKETLHIMDNLKFLNFSSNKLNSIDKDAFSSFSKLEDLDLSDNSNLALPVTLFSNLTSLKSLNLSGCGLVNIPTQLFYKTQNIEVLNMSGNSIVNVENNAFQNLTKLRIIDLSYNSLESLPEYLLYPLKNLREIFLNFNKLKILNYKLFWSVHTLHTIDLSNNLIKEFMNPIKFKASKILLRHNSIAQFPIFLIRVVGLDFLDLSYNNISTLDLMKGLMPETSYMEIDLSHNQIHQLNITDLENRNPKYSNKHLKAMLDLSGNMLKCNCLHYTIEQVPRSPNQTIILQLTSKENLCFASYPHNNCPLIHVTNCPQSCNCYYTRPLNNIVVDCSFRNITRYPQIHNMETNQYEPKQTYLELSGNMLNMEGQEILKSYSDVTWLNLSHNRIEEIKWIPPKIRELYLDNNNLKTLSKDIINNLTANFNLSNVSFQNNPWECDCNAIPLQKYLQNNTYSKVNRSDFVCSYSGELLVYAKLCESSSVLKVAIPLALTGVLALVSATLALYFKYSTSIKIYLYSKNLCLWCVAEEEIDKEKNYDVFISYSHKDEQFVQTELLPELESGEMQFKVCIHYRDWLPGEFISTQIVQSVLDSRRTLVILSNNFMESVWGKMEFRTAHLQAINEGMARVIVVLYGDLDENVLDDEMKTYLKTNTYVKWGDPWFWSKLKYALPHSKFKNGSRSMGSRESFRLK